VKTDEPGYLDVKLAIISKDGTAWIEPLEALGTVEHTELIGEWIHRSVCTSAVLRDMKIRVFGYIGPPTADVRVGFVGADRVVSDGVTEIPDVSIADVPRMVGPPSKDTLLGALKEVLREAAGKST
jgi:hypothetical protein